MLTVMRWSNTKWSHTKWSNTKWRPQEEAFCDAYGRYLNMTFGMSRELYEAKLRAMMSNSMGTLLRCMFPSSTRAAGVQLSSSTPTHKQPPAQT